MTNELQMSYILDDVTNNVHISQLTGIRTRNILQFVLNMPVAPYYMTFAKFMTFKFLLTGEILLFLFIYFKQLQHQGLQEFTPKQPLPIYIVFDSENILRASAENLFTALGI